MVSGTLASSDFSPGVPQDFAFRLIPVVSVDVSHRPDETSPVSSPAFTASRSPYAGGACPERSRRILDGCIPGSSPLPWPSSSSSDSAPSYSPRGANISTLQDLSLRLRSGQALSLSKDSLHVTGCCFTPRSPGGDTSLQYSQSPGCTGRLLRDLLVVFTTGLAPVSRR